MHQELAIVLKTQPSINQDLLIISQDKAISKRVTRVMPLIKANTLPRWSPPRHKMLSSTHISSRWRARPTPTQPDKTPQDLLQSTQSKIKETLCVNPTAPSKTTWKLDSKSQCYNSQTNKWYKALKATRYSASPIHLWRSQWLISRLRIKGCRDMLAHWSSHKFKCNLQIRTTCKWIHIWLLAWVKETCQPWAACKVPASKSNK